ncbi:hypothetical protein [Saccharothrix violaceirubra]|uniref:Uncharacterized protein n=1 Tax=Saccharothrix violaceirubra TaxID=413306 RepID=A0A7W7T2W0_9PSEU|nr:hypothetical protein [Saccharothrix violaceirubra]MBB4965564.1 hypothetical protein [Saccharothrix violaceirubra]
MTRSRLVVLAGCAALATTALVTPAAGADATALGRVYVQANYAGSNGTWVEVCDMERDGNGVYGLFWVNGGSKPTELWDGSGSSGGCGNATYGSVQKFRVCEDVVGLDICSSEARP